MISDDFYPSEEPKRAPGEPKRGQDSPGQPQDRSRRAQESPKEPQESCELAYFSSQSNTCSQNVAVAAVRYTFFVWQEAQNEKN